MDTLTWAEGVAAPSSPWGVGDTLGVQVLPPTPVAVPPPSRSPEVPEAVLEGEAWGRVDLIGEVVGQGEGERVVFTDAVPPKGGRDTVGAALNKGVDVPVGGAKEGDTLALPLCVEGGVGREEALGDTVPRGALRVKVGETLVEPLPGAAAANPPPGL